jgi:hypothetical protein
MRYWRRAVLVASLLRCVPFVRMVGLNGSMVTGTFHKGSDIDLFIVTSDGHIFVARALSALVILLSGLEIRPGREAGMICANRYAIESFVDITPHDIYHAQVFHNLVPLFVDGPAYIDYFEINQWMEMLGEPLTLHRPVLMHNPVTLIIQKLGELIFRWRVIENYVERLQRARIARDWRSTAEGSKVRISEQELRFHVAKDIHA